MSLLHMFDLYCYPNNFNILFKLNAQSIDVYVGLHYLKVHSGNVKGCMTHVLCYFFLFKPFNLDKNK